MNERKQKTTIAIASLVVVLSLVLGISFAYFAAQGQSTEQSITTSNMGIEFGDGTAIVNAAGLKPIMRDEVLTKAAKKTFTVTNTGTEKMYIHISLDDITIPTNLKRYDFVWSLYEGDTNVSNGTFASATTSMDVAPYQVFEVDDEKTYNLYIWIDETGVDQSAMMGQEFKATIKAEGETYYTSPESDFTVTEAGVLTEYTGTDTTVIIPPVVNGIPVTEIGNSSWAIFDALEEGGQFTEANTKVVIPNTVTKLNTMSLYSYGIEDIIIPNSVVEIGDVSLAQNNTKSISIPNSVTKIGTEAFANSLETLFIPNTVVTIGMQAFATNGLSGVVIPSSVTTIDANSDGPLFMNNDNSDLIITVQGKNAAPSTFSEGWNLKDSGVTETFNTVYVP